MIMKYACLATCGDNILRHTTESTCHTITLSYPKLHPLNAETTFVKSTGAQRCLKTI